MSPNLKNASFSLCTSLALCLLTGCPEDDNNGANMGADMSMMPVDTNNTPGCNNTCLDGETKCLNELFILTCEVQANGCRGFGKNAKRCDAGQMCNVTTSKCESDGGGPTECVSNCEPGDPARCNAQGGVETCALRDGMECFTYEESMKCSGDQVCTDGACAAPTCNDAPCTIGATQCEGELVQTCGMMNGCAVFGAATDCPSGETCMGGSCQPAASCEDECIVGADKLCAPGGVPRVCEQSAEGCGQYVDLTACAAGTVCEKGDCVMDVSCPDTSCEAPGARDCAFDSVRECIFAPGSDCGEWNVVEDCGANGFVCNQASAFVQCEPPPMMSSPVVINEVFYNIPGPDVVDMESKSFVELRGAPGQNIENWEVRLVNGSNGMAYKTITLDPGATIGSNGTALIIPDNGVRFLDFQVFVGTNIVGLIPTSGNDDGIQNGPDNVELWDASGNKVDALGYGDFGMSDVFTGEGTSPGRVFENRSLGRRANSPDTDDNSVDFISLYPTPGQRNGDLFINEVYVDQPGSDGQADNIETFVELRAPITDSSWIDIELDQYNLRAVNGLNGMDYIFNGALPGVDFSGSRLQDALLITGDFSAEGMVIICNIDASLAVISRCSVPYEGVDFQNGPDNFVLEYQGRVIDAIGYGSFSGTDVSLAEGSPVPLSSSQAGKSLNRSNNGSQPYDTDNNAADFYLADPSPASPNAQP